MSEDRKRVNNGQMGGRRGGPMGGMGRPVEKAKDFKGTLKRLLRYLRPHKINLIIVLIFAIASTLFTISAPKITSKAMNKLQDAYMARKMISEMSKGQNEAVTQMKDKMGDVQKETVDKINEKMIEGQKKDDSFSALDFKTDAKLRAALKKETLESTVIIVAQRVGTVMDADRIIVLDEGSIVGIGTHRELLDKCDVYREIVSSQLSEEEIA